MTGTVHDPAGSADGGPGPGRYLIGSGQGDLPAELGDVLHADDRVRVVREPAAGVLAVETTATVVDELRTRYGDRLIIEPDLELDALPPAGPHTPGAAMPARDGDHDD